MMIRLVVVCLVFLSGMCVTAHGQSAQRYADVSNLWQVYDPEEGYRPYTEDDAGTHAVYLLIQEDEHRGRALRISGEAHPSVFVNGKLVTSLQADHFDLDLDSARQATGSSTLWIGIYQNRITPANVQTQMLTTVQVGEDGYVERPAVYFRDFVVTATLLLMIFLVVVIRLNSKLASDYFSVTKMFLAQEADDSALSSRGSGSNLLYYFFCSLIVALYLMIIFHFVGDRYTMAWFFRADTFIEATGQWLKLAAIVFAVLMTKIFIVYIGTRLFGLPEVAGLQISSWIRLLFVVSGVLTVVLIIYFVSRGLNENVYSRVYGVIPWAVAGWLLILFPRVARRADLPMFHIFSYLCATEIIPLLISIKLLYH